MGEFAADILAGAICIIAIVIAGVLGGLTLAVFSHWLTMFFCDFHACESPAPILAYAVTALIAIAVGCCIHSRYTTKEWWLE